MCRQLNDRDVLDARVDRVGDPRLDLRDVRGRTCGRGLAGIRRPCRRGGVRFLGRGRRSRVEVVARVADHRDPVVGGIVELLGVAVALRDGGRRGRDLDLGAPQQKRRGHTGADDVQDVLVLPRRDSVEQREQIGQRAVDVDAKLGLDPCVQIGDGLADLLELGERGCQRRRGIRVVVTSALDLPELLPDLLRDDKRLEVLGASTSNGLGGGGLSGSNAVIRKFTRERPAVTPAFQGGGRNGETLIAVPRT